MLAALGFDPADGLYWLYALLPVAVSFVAEQLRVTSAETVLDDAGLENAQAVGELDEGRQRSVVLAIVRREMGVMTAGALRRRLPRAARVGHRVKDRARERRNLGGARRRPETVLCSYRNRLETAATWSAPGSPPKMRGLAGTRRPRGSAPSRG